MNAETRKDGFVLVDKPDGWSSFDAVRWVRKALKGAKVGHAGTLDPFATGLLILLVGKATRLMRYLEDYRKSYSGVMRLGITTDTCDLTGTVIEEKSADIVSSTPAVEIADAFASWVGEVEQIPPKYSAVKIEGEPAYRLARRGEAPELDARDITIHKLVMDDFTPPDVTFSAVVGTGTYLRALARDVGEQLDLGGHLRELRRTGIGPFDVEDAFPLAQPEGEGYVREWIRPMTELLPKDIQIEVTPAQAKHLKHGNELRLPAQAVRHAAEYSHVGVVCRDDLVAVGRLVVVGTEGLFQPRTVLISQTGEGG
ncbi:tRNA pseudouridine(55) synthase TruB [Candidatus Zixiibacteriota bacterium]